MKTTILIPALMGFLGFLGARILGVENGLLQLAISVGCMMILGGGILLFMKKRGS